MYYYAFIDSETGICYDVYETESPITDDPYCIKLDSYDKTYMFRKKYVDGVWVDTTASEAQQFEGSHIGIFGEWLDIVINGKADITHTHDGYAVANHTHDGYASSDDLALLEDVIDTKANATHTHSEYASSSHGHDDYATVVALDTLGEEVGGKADLAHTHTEYATTTHVHSEYASSSHTHTASEIGAATSGHKHDNDYADINHNHDSVYATIGHDHDEDYAVIDHAHTDYATTTALNELSAIVSGKANTSHSHNDTYYTETEIDNKLADKSDVTHTHTGVYDVNGAAANALSSANAYTNAKIDTLSETVVTKANASDLTSHTGNTTVHITSTERNNWNAAKTHANSAHAPSNAEENQNAFSNIVVNGTTISADTKTDTLTFVAGNNVTITPDATGDSITISSANTVYTHPTSAGNKHIPAGGSSGQILRWSADGTAVWGSDNNTTYSNATQTASGLMSDTDKTKLDGIAEGANKYTLPLAGTTLGGVKTGGDVTISSGVITVNDDSHNHIISNVDGLQSALDGKAASGHDHNSVYYTETEVDTLLSGKANSSHTHTIANITNLQSTLDGKANTSHGTHVSYSTTAPVMDGAASVGTTSTVARSDHRHPTDTSRAAQTSLDAHTTNKTNPHGVTLAQLGLTATAAELNALDGITATVTELNYMNGATSNVQTQLNGKAASSHGTHVAYGTTAPKANGTAAVGTASTVSRSDHIHPLQTTVSGNAGTATKLATSRTISLTGDVSGSTSFDGSGNVSITATVADDSHNHIISNIDGLQSALDGKSATSHTHTAQSLVSMADALFATSYNGGVEYSYGSNSGKNVLTEISNMSAGLHTIYSIAGTTGNPKTTESWRMLVHKTSVTIGWVLAFDAEGSIYSNYQSAAGTFKGWRCIYDVTPPILWMGEYWCTDTQTVTPSKPLSQCRNGWVLVWSDYDTANEVSTNGDCFTTVIPKWNPNHVKWSGQSFIAAVPTNLGSDGVISFCGKRLYVHDTKITGNTVNDVSPANDCCLRAIYEY